MVGQHTLEGALLLKAGLAVVLGGDFELFSPPITLLWLAHVEWATSQWAVEWEVSINTLLNSGLAY